MKTVILSAAYFTSGLLYVLSSYRPLGIKGLFFKALIIPFLIIIFLLNVAPFRTSAEAFLLAALLFSWAGDILLHLKRVRGSYFVPALAAFLIAHVCYIIVFLNQSGGGLILRQKTWILVPVLLYGFSLIIFLYDNLGKMKVPVIIYAAAILCMLSSAISLYGKINPTSFIMIFSGALLFVISDSILAINRFGHRFTAAQAGVMATYVSGQFLIVLGYIFTFREALI